MKQGPFTITYTTGETFAGVYRDHILLEGTGTYHIRTQKEIHTRKFRKLRVWSTDVYTGALKEGKQFGEGTLVMSSGEVRKGYWDGDSFKGTVTYPDGSVQEGEWVNGVKV